MIVAVTGDPSRHQDELAEAIGWFRSEGCAVRQPIGPTTSKPSAQTPALLWLACADGHIGTVSCVDIGAALASGTPVFSSTAPDDLTLKQYVMTVRNPKAAINALRHRVSAQVAASDPNETITALHSTLEDIRVEMSSSRLIEDDPVRHILDEQQLLLRSLRPRRQP